MDEENARELVLLDGIEANFACVAALPTADAGAYKASLERLQRRAEREPGSAEVQALLGKAYGALSLHPKARAHLQRALEIDPRGARARAWLGQLDLVEGRFASAEREF